ncbi:hypothetical protein [Plantactinospora sp. ZYX-F-223]|uniref:hypothetical protein n=1 Tax=Plantactinospora sp. ZYX-F-223 TaxID=3144103 RepID=UPI0031FE1BBF
MEYATARIVRQVHGRGGPCLNCTRGCCPVDVWAAEVLRREEVVRILLSGLLPDDTTVDDIRAALEHVG